jgi:hypothetical protein
VRRLVIPSLALQLSRGSPPVTEPAWHAPPATAADPWARRSHRPRTRGRRRTRAVIHRRATCPSTRPSLEYQRHHDVVPPEISDRIFRPAWLHRTRLLQLRDTELIDEPQLTAACYWRADHDRAYASFGLTGGYLPKIDGAPGGARQVHRLDALRRLREAAAALGQWRTLCLTRLVAYDDSWPVLGKLLVCSDKTARVRAAEVITALHEHQSGRGPCRRRP